MIFGNPGIYYKDGTYSEFAIVIEHLTADLYSLNLCVDIQMIPPHLAYNMKSMFVAPLTDRDVFKTQSPALFHLSDKELMIALAKQYCSEWKVEERIRLGLQPTLYTTDKIEEYEESLYDDSYFDFENFVDYLWDIEPHEYGDKGWFPFIINNKDETKLVIIHIHRNPKNLDDYPDDLKEYERFFNADKSPKQPKYFDEHYWSVKVIKMRTAEMLALLDEAYAYLFGGDIE